MAVTFSFAAFGLVYVELALVEKLSSLTFAVLAVAKELLVVVLSMLINKVRTQGHEDTRTRGQEPRTYIEPTVEPRDRVRARVRVRLSMLINKVRDEGRGTIG